MRALSSQNIRVRTKREERRGKKEERKKGRKEEGKKREEGQEGRESCPGSDTPGTRGPANFYDNVLNSEQYLNMLLRIALILRLKSML